MPRLQRDPPQRMFTPSELRRLMSMIFMLVVLFMVIQQTRKVGSARWLIGRSGDKDQVIGKFDDRDEVAETTPAPPEHNAVAAASSADAASKLAATAAAKSPPAATPGSPSAKTGPAPAQPPAASSAAPAPAKAPAEKNQPADKNQPTEKAQPAETPPQTAATPVSKIPPATGPTDEDSSESAAAPKDFDLIYDRTDGTKDVEEPAFERIARWVVHQPYQRLAARVTQKNPPWGQFITQPEESRRPGRIYQMDVHIRKVETILGTEQISAPGAPEPPVQLYSMWGDTTESRGRFFQLIVYEPPGGIPGNSITLSQDVRFVGYFFKTEVYEAASSTPSKPVPLYAPTFVGRVVRIEAIPSEFAKQGDYMWLAIVGGGSLLILGTWIGWMVLHRKTMKSALQVTDLRVPQGRTIDDWLTQPRDSSAVGNNSLDSDESQSEEARERSEKNGHTGNRVRLFGDPQDGGDPLSN